MRVEVLILVQFFQEFKLMHFLVFINTHFFKILYIIAFIAFHNFRLKHFSVHKIENGISLVPIQIIIVIEKRLIIKFSFFLVSEEIVLNQFVVHQFVDLVNLPHFCFIIYGILIIL